MIDFMHRDEKKLSCPRRIWSLERLRIFNRFNLIDRLVANGGLSGHSGDVYFRVSAFPAYGKLNNRKLDDMIAGARIDVAEDKENLLTLCSGNRRKRAKQPGLLNSTGSPAGILSVLR